MMMPPVGKSGPLMYRPSCCGVMSGLSIAAITPSITSPRLCGGMFVAMPTAIPAEPFTMGVVLPHDVADHARGLLGGAVGTDALHEHPPQNPAVDRLQAVADVGQGP